MNLVSRYPSLSLSPISLTVFTIMTETEAAEEIAKNSDKKVSSIKAQLNPVRAHALHFLHLAN
jgi:hypothetical protein